MAEKICEACVIEYILMHTDNDIQILIPAPWHAHNKNICGEMGHRAQSVQGLMRACRNHRLSQRHGGRATAPGGRVDASHLLSTVRVHVLKIGFAPAEMDSIVGKMTPHEPAAMETTSCF